MSIEFSKSKITRDCHTKTMIVITGLTRSGKTMLAPIIASLERVEHIGINYLLELVAMMHIACQINDDAAVNLMRSGVDFMQYDAMIGRNANFRYGDYSSIWKSKEPSMYFQRLLMEEGDSVYQRIDALNPIFLLFVHDALWHADLYFKAFPDLRMLHLDRNPIDLAYSWYKKEFGKDWFNSARNATLTIEWRSKKLPYYAAGWEDEFLMMSEGDRIVQMISKLLDAQNKKFDHLSQKLKGQVKRLKFEEFVTQTDTVLDKITEYLGVNRSQYTQAICERERCPRLLKAQDRNNKLKELEAILSTRMLKKLLLLNKQY